MAWHRILLIDNCVHIKAPAGRRTVLLDIFGDFDYGSKERRMIVPAVGVPQTCFLALNMCGNHIPIMKEFASVKNVLKRHSDECSELPGMGPRPDILRVLNETSRTFYIPITRLPMKLQETVSAAYLCSRALDEIEDNFSLGKASKVSLLQKISRALVTNIGLNPRTPPDFGMIFRPYRLEMPEVSLRIGEWLAYSPTDIAPRIWYAAATMADRMAYWVSRNWQVRTEDDLNGYTFDVAGATGLLICDIWSWFTGTQIDRTIAVQFGRGLQAVNILRNREEDLQRQVDFYPLGWRQEHMFSYARSNLNHVKRNVNSIPRDAYAYLCEVPLLLAEATLDALEKGKPKLTRRQVEQIVNQAPSLKTDAGYDAEATGRTTVKPSICTAESRVESS